MAVSGKLGRSVSVVDDVFLSHEHESYPTSSLHENCIEFEIQTYRSFYVDLRQTYSALKLKLVKGRGYEIYYAAKEKEHKENATADAETEFLSLLM